MQLSCDLAMEVEEALLSHLQQHSNITNSEEWASSAGFDHSLVKDVVKSLHGFGYVEAEVCRFSLNPCPA